MASRSNTCFQWSSCAVPEMEWLKSPLKGVANDIRGRAQCYKDDWTCAFRSGIGYVVS